jgi:hypothetical protein
MAVFSRAYERNLAGPPCAHFRERGIGSSAKGYQAGEIAAFQEALFGGETADIAPEDTPSWIVIDVYPSGYHGPTPWLPTEHSRVVSFDTDFRKLRAHTETL